MGILLFTLWCIGLIISTVPPLGRWIYVRIPGIQMLWHLESMLYPGNIMKLKEEI